MGARRLRQWPPVASPAHTSSHTPELHVDLYDYFGKEHVIIQRIDLAEGPILLGISQETGRIFRVKLIEDDEKDQ